MQHSFNTPAQPADVWLIELGSVFLLQLLTADAQRWVDSFVSKDRIMFGNGLAVEPRYVASIVTAMQHGGLVIAVDGGWQ